MIGPGSDKKTEVVSSTNNSELALHLRQKRSRQGRRLVKQFAHGQVDTWERWSDYKHLNNIVSEAAPTFDKKHGCYQARRDCWQCSAVQGLLLLADWRNNFFWKCVWHVTFGDSLKKDFIFSFSPAAVVAATQELSSWETLAKCSLRFKNELK